MINAKSTQYFNKLIKEFAAQSSPIFSSPVFGYSDVRFSWVSDFIFKVSGNTSINKNVGYISFFSDYQEFIQDYASIPTLRTKYPFLATTIADQYGKTIELTTKQYQKIGQKDIEKDVVAYVDAAEYYKSLPNADIQHVDKYHRYGYNPVFWVKGYFDGTTYTWMYNSDTGTDASRVGNFYCELQFGPPETDTNNLAVPSLISGGRVYSYKIQVDNIQRFILPGEIGRYYIEHSSAQHFSALNYQPYIFPVQSICSDVVLYNMTNTYFPHVIYKGQFASDKISIENNAAQKYDINVFANKLCCNNESDDQSRLQINICKEMIDGTGNVVRSDPDANVLYAGISVDLLRNRRYSAVVTTEPYMVCDSICNGYLVDYMFMTVNPDKTLSSVNFTNANPKLILKIKAPAFFIKELDRQLSIVQINSDIKETIEVDRTSTPFANNFPDYYTSFQSVNRQDDGVDEVATKPVYTTAGDSTVGYHLGKKTVSGMGYIYYSDHAGDHDAIRIYSSGYYTDATPSNLLAGGTAAASTLNEKFKPMIKLSGMDGYIKIDSASTYYSRETVQDGDTIAYYHVEFPWCCGSYTVRLNLSSSYSLTQVLVMRSYLKAGNWTEDVSTGTVNTYNERKKFQTQDYFTDISFVKELPDDITVNSITYPKSIVFQSVLYKLLQFSNGAYICNLSDVADHKLIAYMSNKRWMYGDNSYESYVNRESPSYIFAINTSSLNNTYDHKRCQAFPEMKRWLYSYYKGAAITRDLATGQELTDFHSDSSIVMDIWSNEANDWRPFVPFTFDTLKVHGDVICDNFVPNPVIFISDNMYQVTLTYQQFLDDVENLSLVNNFSLPRQTNLVLRDKVTMKNYHVAYCESPASGSPTTVTMYVISDFPPDLTQDTSDNGSGQLSLNFTKNQLNDTSFEMYSSRYSITPDAYIKRFIDRSGSDLANYIINDTILFRIRILRARDYPFTNGIHGTDMQLSQTGITSSTAVDKKYPWINTFTPSEVWDTKFDYSLINIKEYISLLKLDYFRCASK